MAASLLLLAATPALLGAAAPGQLEIEVGALRNGNGHLLFCLTREPAYFPDCKADPNGRHLAVPARKANGIAFDDLPTGDYAISAFHDENDNGKLDTFLAIPKEGFGFSRNPKIGFGPPPFSAVRFGVTNGRNNQVIRFHYLL